MTKPVKKSNKRAKQIVRDHKSIEYWTIIGLGSKTDYIECKCRCGVTREVNVYSLTSGKSKSCGCKIRALKEL